MSQSWLRNLVLGTSTKDATSIMDVVSTTQGSRPIPSMTTAQRDAISTPATGLQVFNTDLNQVQFYTGAAWVSVGVFGSPSTSFNYLALRDGNPDAETSTYGWATYADAAATTPADGTGGSPSVTLTRSTVAGNILRGSASFLMSKDAVNRQGQGISKTFSIDNTDQGKTLYVSFDYLTSANYAANDLYVFIYDVTNASLLRVFGDDSGAPGRIAVGASPGVRFAGRFTAASNSTSYRLIIHIASTSAAAYDVSFDNFVITPQALVPGVIVTEWQSFTPTMGVGSGSITNSTASARWRRVGDTLEVKGALSFSGAGGTWSGGLTATIPSGLTIDTTKLPQTTWQIIGETTWWDNGTTGGGIGVVVYNATDKVGLYVDAVTTHTGTAQVPSFNIVSNFPITWASGDTLTYEFSVPISGWTTGGVLSTTDVLFSTVKARYTSTSTSAVPNSATVFNFSTKTYDTASSVTTGAGWNFKAPRTAYYKVSVRINFLASSSLSRYDISIRKNALTYKTSFITPPVSTVNTSAIDEVIYLVTGDTVDVTHFETVDGGTYTNDHSITIEEIPDFSTFSVYGNFELQTATSSVKTPSASANWNLMTGNSVVLSPGTWRLFGTALFSNNGTTPAYSFMAIGFYGANGADSGVEPTLLSATAGVTVLSVGAGVNFFTMPTSTAQFDGMWSPPPVIVRLTQPVTVYMVPRAGMTTAANARITVYLNAERLQ